jgi:Flp pilus assembly protein TadG
MRELIVRSWRQFAGDHAGEEIAEAALVLPLLFIILIAVFWFGQAFRIYTTLTQAARQGARGVLIHAKRDKCSQQCINSV